ncbi:hypothetical protein [Streptomyces sp. NPDC020917]|uniref:hypothetical protein n=1 Tax=Streptomyces sp. NPDC020917 TaxID=3365102 RepID=UPI0037A97FD3
MAATYRPVEATAPPSGHPDGGADAGGRERAAGPEQATRPEEAALPRTPEAAFDALYVRSAGALLRQVELLTGDPVFAGHAVARAFDLAWQRWPEVAEDSDPVGWVRAAAYEYALAPWQRWVPGAAHRLQPHPPEDSLAAALLDLPPAHRRALMLHDGLGLDLPDAAAEVEASTASTAARITHAREALTAALPEPAQPLSVRLGALLDGEQDPPQEPAGVREASERGVHRRTVGAFGLTGLIAAVTLTVVLAGPGTGKHATPPDAPAPAASTPHAANAPEFVQEFLPPSAPLVTPSTGMGAPPAGPPWAPLAPAPATPPATPGASAHRATTGTPAAAPPVPHRPAVTAAPVERRSPAGASSAVPSGPRRSATATPPPAGPAAHGAAATRPAAGPTAPAASSAPAAPAASAPAAAQPPQPLPPSPAAPQPAAPVDPAAPATAAPAGAANAIGPSPAP